MPRLHLAAGPGQHRLAGEALAVVEMRDGGVERLAVGRHEGPEGQRHLLLGRHADAAPQDRHRVEHEALASGQPGAGVERRRVGDRAAAPDEGAAVRLGLDLAAEAAAAAHEMRIGDVGIVLVALAPGA